MDERIDESILRLFGNIDRMENDRVAKRVYVGEYVGSRLVGQLQKRWIGSVNNCLKKRDLNVGRAGRMVYDRNEWRKFVYGNAWGINL